MAEISAQDIVNLGRRDRTNASLAVTSDIDANPDQAARAMELSRSSGVEGSIIYDDMDGFERNYKAQMAGAIVRNNAHLTEFVRSNPLVPKIANDDYGNLDSVSQKTSALDLGMKVLRAPEALGKIMFGEGDPLHRFTEGGPLGNWILQDENIRKNYPFAGAVAAGLATPIELILRGLGGVQNTAADMAANLVGTVDPSLGRDLGGMIQSAGLTGRTGQIEHPIYKVVEAVGPIKHWIDNGREPPPGVHPEYDAYRAERNAKDVDQLGEVVDDAQNVLMRQRNIDLLRDFERQHTDAEIGISGDVIAKLYGEKRPVPDDGILGWVPNIEGQLELALKSGDDIHVPVADLIAKMEPDVYKALMLDMRIRPGAITATEAAIAKEQAAAQPPPIPLPEEVPAQRAAAGLEPLLSVGDRNIRMEKRPTEMKTDTFGADQWRLLDEQGNKVGHLELTPHGDRLYVDVVQGLNGLGPRDFGPALMRSLLRQIKEQYPDAKEIGGFRISGARERAGSEKEAWIKLDRLENIDYNRFQEVLEGGQWETYSPNIKGYIKPDFLRAEEDRQLVNIVTEELDRIVPKKVAIQDVDTAKVEGTIAGQRAAEPIQIGGAYIRYRDTYPLILYALDGENALGAARHEAIHHLRGYGFFKEGEWQTLEAQALAEGWLTKYGIDRRYPEANPSLKLEEAIAEAYRDWAGGAKAPTPEIHGLFERMKAFFAAIKERISQLLGKDATWEDVFQKVDTGEVGAREGTKPLDPRAFDEKLATDDKSWRRFPKQLTEYEKEMAKFAAEDAKADARTAEFKKLGREHAESAIDQRRDYEDSRGSHEVNLRDTIHENYKEVSESDINNAVDSYNKIWDAFTKSLDEKLSVPEEPSRIFERANALGMTIEQFKRYDKLIAARHAEDVESATSRIADAQKKVQSKEWKANRATLRAQVAEEINLRPDIAADNYFADGVLYGEKVDRIKLGTDYLTEQQRASLPRDYYNKAGVSPDDLAGLFGFPDGATLVGHLSGLSEIRRQSGMRPIEFKRRVIDIETDRQMQVKYGVLEDNIMDAVKEQVASETQVNILHEQTLYYGIKAGEAPLDQATIKREVAADFDRYAVTAVNSDRFLALAGRSGKKIIEAATKEDWAGAFREQQHQYYSTLLAKHAIEFENQTAKFEKLATRLSKREVPRIAPEYLDFIHELLLESGMPIKRSLDEIGASMAHYGEGNLGRFVENPVNRGYDLDAVVSDALQNGKPKSLDAMNVAEMKDFMNAVTSLNHVGRKVDQIEVAGEKMRKAEFRQEVIDNFKQLTPLTRQQQQFSLGKLRRIVDAPLTRMEELLKDADLRKELGPLYRAVIEPMMHSKAHEFDMMTDLSKYFQQVRGSFDKKWRKSLGDTINQDIIIDPYTSEIHSERAPYDMSRENLIQIMLNWGSRSNIGKYVQGAAMAKYGRRLTKEEFPLYEAQIKGLIDKHATEQDWQFVSAVWEPFKKWRPDMETVSRNTTGFVPKMIEHSPVQTPFGTIDGGYWPVKYDRLGSNIGTIEERKPSDTGTFGSNYFRAATSKSHLQERTGYVDFVDINTSLEQAAGTMQQTIHDISFRDALLQSSNVLYDKGIRAAMTRYMGEEYTDQLGPWLRDVAHQFTTDDKATKWYNAALRRMRINLVGHALPFNLKVILSPDIGVPNPAVWARFEANRSDNTKLAMEKSDEIRHLVYNMDRDYRESLNRITLDPTISDFQKKAVQWGFAPIAKVSQEFRMATFIDKYQDALGRGRTEVEAASIADSAVREQHGAASIVDLPAVMRGNEAMKMMTMFYGYFNTMYNWQRQIPGNIRRGEYGKAFENGLGSVVVGAVFGAVLFNNRKEDDSWFKIAGKAILLQPLATVPGLREGASYFIEGYQPRTPLASLLGAAGSILNDTKKAYKGERLEKPITHAANVIGLTTGLPAAQIGRTAQFTSDVIRGRQKPKNIADWARGIITGEAKLKK